MFKLCLCAAASTLRMTERLVALDWLRKLPEIFCFSFFRPYVLFRQITCGRNLRPRHPLAAVGLRGIEDRPPHMAIIRGCDQINDIRWQQLTIRLVLAVGRVSQDGR